MKGIFVILLSLVTSLSYAAASNVDVWLTSIGGPGGLYVLNGGYQLTGDFNGDGKEDYLWYTVGWNVALSNGTGFNTPTQWLSQYGGPGGVVTYNGGYQYVADMNGDGKDDFVWYASGWNVALSTGTGFSAPTRWLAYNGGPGGVITYNGGYQYLADMNGDGKDDFVWYASGWNVALSTGTGFSAPTRWLTYNGGPGGVITYNGGYQFFADFNGDGMDDYLWYASGWNVALSTGGGFSAPVRWLTYNGGPGGGLTYSANKMRIGDFNGDGLADYMWHYANKWNVALSYGTGFYTPTTWLTGYGSYSPLVGDFNADGIDDGLFWNQYVGWYLGTSSGSTFGSPSLWLHANGGPGGILTYAYGAGNQFSGDFDGNGTADFFWAGSNYGSNGGWNVAR